MSHLLLLSIVPLDIDVIPGLGEMEPLAGILFKGIPVGGKRLDLLVHLGNIPSVHFNLLVLLAEFDPCLHPADEVVVAQEKNPHQDYRRRDNRVTDETPVFTVPKILQLAQFASVLDVICAKLINFGG